MCPHCHDTYWRSTIVDGVERVVRCECWREKWVDRTLANAGIPNGYKHCALNTFDHRGTNSLMEALQKTTSFAERFPVVDRGLFFLGPTGVGKTHLAVAALREVISSRGAKGYFFKTAELLQRIRNTYNDSVEQTEMDVLTPVFDADVLVLDDVGTERPTEWVQETLGVLIDKRYSSRKPTILTANLNDDSSGKDFYDSVQFRLGARTRSRLKEMCDWVFIESYDTREVGIHPSDKKVGEWSRRTQEVRAQVPDKAKGMAKARLRPGGGSADLKWTGGKAGS